MFGIGGWEFVLIAVLALLLFGPDKLPQFARTLGRFMRDFKRYQAMAESTIRAEVFAADPSLRKDAFDTAKAFRKKVAGGEFSHPDDNEAPAPEPEATPETTTDAEAPETAESGPATEPVVDGAATMTEHGEGERDEA